MNEAASLVSANELRASVEKRMAEHKKHTHDKTLLHVTKDINDAAASDNLHVMVHYRLPGSVVEILKDQGYDVRIDNHPEGAVTVTISW